MKVNGSYHLLDCLRCNVTFILNSTLAAWFQSRLQFTLLECDTFLYEKKNDQAYSHKLTKLICRNRKNRRLKVLFFTWLLFLRASTSPSNIGRDSNQFNLSGIPGGGHSLHLMRVFCGWADCFEPFACTVHLD